MMTVHSLAKHGMNNGVTVDLKGLSSIYKKYKESIQ